MVWETKKKSTLIKIVTIIYKIYIRVQIYIHTYIYVGEWTFLEISELHYLVFYFWKKKKLRDWF